MQLPIRLAFARTVHEGQGWKLKNLVLDLRSSFLSPGKLYVALLQVNKSADIVLSYNQSDKSDTLHNLSAVQNEPVTVYNSVLTEAVQFVASY